MKNDEGRMRERKEDGRREVVEQDCKRWNRIAK